MNQVVSNYKGLRLNPEKLLLAQLQALLPPPPQKGSWKLRGNLEASGLQASNDFTLAW